MVIPLDTGVITMVITFMGSMGTENMVTEIKERIITLSLEYLGIRETFVYRRI